MDFTHIANRMPRTRESNAKSAQAFGGFLFVGSVAWYVRSSFLSNRSVPKLVLFTGASYLFAQEWAKFLLLPVVQEAAMINNVKEAGKNFKDSLT